MAERPIVHRFPVDPEGAFVNASLVETAAGVVAVDSLLTVSDSRAMHQALERLGKPLQAVLLTHSHPDHYAGLAQLLAEDEVPIIAPHGVIDTIARDDALKDTIVGPMFGDEWPGTRSTPTWSKEMRLGGQFGSAAKSLRLNDFDLDRAGVTEHAAARAGRREWVGLAVLALPCLVYAMDLTVLNLALPALSDRSAPFPGAHLQRGAGGQHLRLLR